MKLKNSKKKVIISVIVVIVAIVTAILIFALNHTEKPTPPEFGFFEIHEHDVTLHPSKKYLSTHQSTTDGELLYCLNDEPTSDACNWQTSARYYIEYDYTYYAFIKSTATGLISEPEMLNYSTPGYINGHEMQI